MNYFSYVRRIFLSLLARKRMEGEPSAFPFLGLAVYLTDVPICLMSLGSMLAGPPRSTNQ